VADCIFCMIVSGEVPAEKLRDDEHVIAFRDIHPQAPTHVLIVPRKHLDSANELAEEDDALGGRLFAAAAALAGELGIAESGYRLIVNCNRDGGQEVMHLHLHLLGGRPLGPMLTRSH